jgi:hypothetical protein
VKKEKVSEREIWAAIFENPIEYARSLRYVLASVVCMFVVVLIHVACTWGGQ